MEQDREWTGRQEGDSLSILLITASADNAAFIEHALRQDQTALQLHVSRENNLIQGFEFLRTSAADIVLLDMELSGSAAFDNIAFMHKLFPALPIIVISGVPHAGTWPKVLQSGAQVLLTREECDSITLRSAIGHVLAGKQEENPPRRAWQ